MSFVLYKQGDGWKAVSFVLGVCRRYSSRRLPFSIPWACARGIISR